MKELTLSATEQDLEVQKVLTAALSSMEENFVALVDKEVSLKSEKSGLTTRQDITDALEGERSPCMAGTVGKDYSGKIILLVNLPDAITFSCYLRMIAEDAVKERRGAGTYDDEDRESFGEVGNILFSAVDEVFRTNLNKAVSFRLESAPELEPGTNEEEIIPDGSLYVHRLSMKIGDFPAGDCVLIMPQELAAAMNQGALAPEVGDGQEEEDEDDVPTEITGTLAVFSINDPTNRLAKEATGKVGMALDVRPAGEVPNPAKLKDKFVLLEIPEDGDKYFQWCQRLKKSNNDIPILVALVWPTKHLVLAAYKAGVDQILGLPCKPNDLLRKLGRIVEAKEAAAAAAEEGSEQEETEPVG